MTRPAGMLVFVLALALGACQTVSVGQAPATAVLTTTFGPVIGQEVITGRADAGDEVVLIAGGMELVGIDVRHRRARRATIQVPPGKECWGLARLADGALWTLEDRRTATRLDLSGAVLDRVPLDSPQFGVFAAGNRLVYQEASFTAPGPALYLAAAKGSARVPWSTITTRTFPALARASVAALNMVSCGATQAAERACWFADAPALFLVRQDGTTRRVVMEGIEAAVPEQLLTSETPRRPVRDAFVDAQGVIWILSSGAPPKKKPDVPGAWLLAKYRPDGGPGGIARLPEAARLVLGADARHVTLLMSSGRVAEVDRW